MKFIKLIILLLVPTVVFAWEPTHTVTVILGQAPGSGNELAFRKVAEIVQRNNPTFTYVIEHRPGADTVVAQNHLYEQLPNGYTIGVPSHMSTYVTNDIWEVKLKKFKYNSFVNVLTIGKSPLVLVASPHSNVATPKEFIKLISTTNKPVNIAIGSGAHRTAYEYLMFKGRGKVDFIKSISFNGPMQAVTSVAQYDGIIGTEFGILPITVARPLIEAGKVKPIGFTGTRRVEQYPNVPLLSSVTPGINAYAAWAINLPPNTPQEIVSWYQQAFAQAVRSKEYGEWLHNNMAFYEADELTPVGLSAHIEELRSAFIPVLEKIKTTAE